MTSFKEKKEGPLLLWQARMPPTPSDSSVNGHKVLNALLIRYLGVNVFAFSP